MQGDSETGSSLKIGNKTGHCWRLTMHGLIVGNDIDLIKICLVQRESTKRMEKSAYSHRAQTRRSLYP